MHPALLDDLRPVRFADASMGGVAPRHLDLMLDLPEAAIAAIVAAGDEATVEVRRWGGAIADGTAAAGPAAHRGVPLSVIADAAVPGLAAALAPHATGGSFLNFLRDPARVETAFTPANLRRLREVKRGYDPDNVFRVGPNIAPADAPGGVAEHRLRW